MTEVVRVPCTLGGHYYVARYDLDNPTRTQLPLYTRGGKRWDETPAGRRAIAKHQAWTIHRGNIGPDDSEPKSTP